MEKSNEQETANESNFIGAVTPTISLVIAARNEEKSIKACLLSLANQQYENFEIILVDDASSDQTSAIALSLKLNNLRLFKNTKPEGKKSSLGQGINHAKGGIIVSTDADCIASPFWLREISLLFRDPDLGFLSMPVLYHNDNSLFEKCESLDFLSLVAIGGALIKLGKPAICNGANIAYKKKLFEAVGGFSASTFSSGDDEMIMRKIFQTGYNVKFHLSANASTYTLPTGDMKSFINQRIRWASKAMGYMEVSPVFLGVLILIYGFNFVLLLSPIWVWFDTLWILFFVIFGLKLTIDFFAIQVMTTLLGRKDLRHVFFFAEVFQIIYVSISPLLAEYLKSRKGYIWKGVRRS